MNVRCWILLLVLLLSGRPLLADLPDAEPSRHFLRRPPLSAYTNYGEDLYRPYRREIRLAPRYDFLGRFLAEGFLVYELDEQRPGGSRIRKDRLYRSLNNLIIAHDSYGPWHWSLTVGDEVRTEFTPLTLRQAGFNGLRWDVVFPANKITLLTTRGFDSSLFPTLNSFSDPVVQGRGSLIDYLERTEDNPVYNIAGHWQTRLGDVLRFGATFVNQHQANTARGIPAAFCTVVSPIRPCSRRARLPCACATTRRKATKLVPLCTTSCSNWKEKGRRGGDDQQRPGGRPLCAVPATASVGWAARRWLPGGARRGGGGIPVCHTGGFCPAPGASAGVGGQ